MRSRALRARPEVLPWPPPDDGGGPVHAGLVRVFGRAAPARIVFETGVGRFASGDVKLDEPRS